MKLRKNVKKYTKPGLKYKKKVISFYSTKNRIENFDLLLAEIQEP